MPRNKPKECIEYRITLGSKERMQLDQLITAVGLNQISKAGDNFGFKKAMSDPKDMVLWLGALATILEALGFETGLPTPIDAIEWLTEYGIKKQEGKYVAESESNPSILTLLKNLLSGEYGGYPGGY